MRWKAARGARAGRAAALHSLGAAASPAAASRHRQVLQLPLVTKAQGAEVVEVQGDVLLKAAAAVLQVVPAVDGQRGS